MRLLNGAAFDGPSLYAAFPAVWLRIQREAQDRPGPLGASALAPALEHLRRQGAAHTGVVARFIDHLAPAATALSPLALVGELALELQRSTGAAVTKSVIAETAVTGTADLAFAFEYGDVGLLAGRLAVALVSLATAPNVAAGAALDRLWSEFTSLAVQLSGYPSAMAFIRAFKARDIPVRRVHGLIYVAGQGRLRKYLNYTITGNTSALGLSIANDKLISNRVLRALGLPATEQVVVNGVEHAVQAAERIGYPVVLKPRGEAHGTLVFVGLEDARQVEAAYARIAEAGFRMLLERVVPGGDHRILVVNGEMVAATQRVHAHVIGDGRQNVEALIEQANRDPRRRGGYSSPMTALILDENAERMLRRAGLSRDSVPASGRLVYLREAANLSQGAVSIDVTDLVHPRNRAMALRVAAACSADVIGIDFITPDIRRPYDEVGGAICEVNVSPGLRMHQVPAVGRPRDVFSPIIDSLYPPGTTARIPSAAITGADRATALALAHILKVAGLRVGVALEGDIFIDGPHPVARGLSASQAASIVFGDAVVDAAVFLFASEDLVRHGLGFDGATVGVVVGASGDAASQGARRIIAAGARTTLVVDSPGADAVAFASRQAPGRRLILVGTPPVSMPAEAALVMGVSEEDIAFTDGAGAQVRIRLPGGMPGVAQAAAIALAMGVAVEDLRLGVATARPASASGPGEYRILRIGGRPRIVVDRFDADTIAENVDLATGLSDGAAVVAVVDMRVAGERPLPDALRAALMQPGFERVILVGRASGAADGWSTAADDRVAIADAIVGAPGAVLFLTDNPERACRFAGYATAS